MLKSSPVRGSIILQIGRNPKEHTLKESQDGLSLSGNSDTETMTNKRSTFNKLAKKSYESAKGKKTDEDVLYAYDAEGQRVSMTDGIGKAAYEYDALGRVTKAKDSVGQAVTYTYDESGNVQEMGYPDGSKVAYEYDLNDNLIKVTDRQGKATEYKYDALNRMVQTIRPNELVTDVAYDA